MARLPAHVPHELVYDIEVLNDPNTLDDPYSVTEGVIETLPPLMFNLNPPGRAAPGLWVATRYEDVREIYQNTDLYSAGHQSAPQLAVGETFTMIPLSVDPPDHAKYRILLNPWFSPKSVNALEPKIRATINELIDSFEAKGECDGAYDYARIFPVKVFLNLMGFPVEKMDEFLVWEYDILHNFGDQERLKRGVRNALAYVRGFIEEIRVKPNDGLASHIVHGQVEGRPVTDDEIIGMIFFLWVAGLDTVAATTTMILRRLALFPDVQQTLRDNPDMIPEAIEEFLRFQPLVPAMRQVRHDHLFRGVMLKAGDQIAGWNNTGNFDPAEFDHPRELRFDRAQNRHFSLGGGPHRCLGSHLARRELRIAIGEFLRRIPQFTLKPGADRKVTPGLPATTQLPLVWKASPQA